MTPLLFFLAVRVYGFVVNFCFRFQVDYLFCDCNSSLSHFLRALAFSLDKLKMHYLLLRFGGSNLNFCFPSQQYSKAGPLGGDYIIIVHEWTNTFMSS